ncbi:expressed unknown protein [Seminavis robusta]|uniref:Uncharacterized protein n=1 Tax=Seminavis robusta TaxID=568900 RepID=A0A9N8E4T9_9STRA|nr:expressed unknown protein [Seminavis robusta]|eukprot:Sro542_g163330.1 n/a (305) ;mRNA; f:15557-16556
MKFATTLFFGLVASASAALGPAQKRLLKKARKLEDNNQNQEEDEFAFLMNYNLKMIQCKAEEAIRNPEDGEYEYGAAIFRLCPEGCDDDLTYGCKSGHGDYVVGLQTFVQAYFEDQRDNMYYDDNFKVDEYAECREYEQENDDGGNNNNAAYFIGPACTEDGSDVKLEIFYDEACSQVPEDVTFEDISNGWSLPYGEGGLVSNKCQPCSEYNGDDGAYELKEMCQELYENAGKCETEMESFHYYGKQEGSCEYIASLMPASKSGGGAKAFGWVVFILVVVGAFSAYAMWWKKKKSGQASDGLMA